MPRTAKLSDPRTRAVITSNMARIIRKRAGEADQTIVDYVACDLLPKLGLEDVEALKLTLHAVGIIAAEDERAGQGDDE